MTAYCPSPSTCSFHGEEPFRCATCGRDVCWCCGAADAFLDDCDACWAIKNTEARDTVPAPAAEGSAAE